MSNVHIYTAPSQPATRFVDRNSPLKRSIKALKRSHIARNLEGEFLILLGATWLKCRWIVMGHGVIGETSGNLAGVLLGMEDYAAEMRLVCEESKAKRVYV
jgi:hypothetical protein